MNVVTKLARPEIVRLRGYTSAAYAPELKRLNANETTTRIVADASERGLNWYPINRHAALSAALATLFDQPVERIMATRGTSEAIDLLIRAFCRPGKDGIVICPPAFGMYGVYADIQGAPVHRVPLSPAPDFALDVDGIGTAVDHGARIVFITSPNNPTGNLMASDAIDAVVELARGRALVVIDAAYHEFSTRVAPEQRYRSEGHVVSLRTLSKAHALAGTRCGVLIGDPAIGELTGKIMAPYAFATPVVETLLNVLGREDVAARTARIARLCDERERLRGELSSLTCVDRVLPSDANFLLVQFANATAALETIRAQGYLVRDFSKVPGLDECLRLTVGLAAENDAVVAALSELSL